MTTMTRNEAAVTEDVGNLVFLEHVNVTVPDQSTAIWFYVVGLGLTRDPYMIVGPTAMWINVGDHQIHTPLKPAQVLRGHVGLVVRDLTVLKWSLTSVQKHLAGTKLAFVDKGDHVDVTCPWGNLYRCYGPGSFGSMTLGIPYIELNVPVGTAAGVRRFYESVFLTPARLEEVGGTAAVVDIGTNQQLVFRESEVVPEYDGHHIAVYVANFSQPYAFLEERGLITEQLTNHQCRFTQIVDPDTGEPLFELEHELRSTRHPLYRRALVNRDPSVPQPGMAPPPAR